LTKIEKKNFWIMLLEQTSGTYRVKLSCSWTLNESNSSKKKWFVSNSSRVLSRVNSFFFLTRAESILIESSRAHMSSTRLISNHNSICPCIYISTFCFVFLFKLRKVVVAINVFILRVNITKLSFVCMCIKFDFLYFKTS